LGYQLPRAGESGQELRVKKELNKKGWPSRGNADDKNIALSKRLLKERAGSM